MKQMKCTVRRAEISDVSKLNALVNSAYRGDSSKRGWTTEADILGGQRIDEARLREIIQSSKHQVLCLIDDNADIIGTVCLERSDKTSSCYLGMLTIQPTAQAGGLGKQLMQSAEAFAKSTWRSDRMTLGVIQLREELMAWYERRGYVRTGKTEPFPYGDVRFGEPKREDLHFVMFEKLLN